MGTTQAVREMAGRYENVVLHKSFPFLLLQPYRQSPRNSYGKSSVSLKCAAFLSEITQHFQVFMLRDRPWLSAVEVEVPNVGLFRLDGSLFDKLLHDLVNTSALIF